MESFPPTLRVQLQPHVESETPSADLLVMLQLFSGKRPYYATFLGLTDATGCVQQGRDKLRADFEASQRFYPMDFKVPLEDCDRAALIVVPGGRRFAEERAQIIHAAHVTPEARRLWSVARNAAVQHAEKQVDLPSAVDAVQIPIWPY